MNYLQQESDDLLDDLVSLREAMRIPSAEIEVLLGASTAPSLRLSYDGSVALCWQGNRFSLGAMTEWGFSHFDQAIKARLESEIDALREQAREETFVWARIAEPGKPTGSRVRSV